MKIYLVLFFAVWCSVPDAVATNPVNINVSDPEVDASVRRYRASEREPSSMVFNKDREPMKFFNGFSVGGSAGFGLFHGDLADYTHLAPFDDFSTHYRFAWRVYAQREIKYGISAKIQFESGTLGGGRITGLQSPKVNFESEYSTLSVLAAVDLWGELFRKDQEKPAKIYLFAEAGIGVTFFRAYTTWTGEDERVRDFIGYDVTDVNPPTQRYTLLGRSSPGVAVNFPVGFTFGYRLNYKTDVTFNYTLNNVLSDELDAWSRDWSAQSDKYSYFGIGLRYNFNREPSDYPKKKKRKDKKADKADTKDRKWKLFGSAKDDVAPNDVKLDGPIESRKGNKVDPAVENKELEEVRVKMFELQLKLFEMQYLLGGGKAPDAPAE